MRSNKSLGQDVLWVVEGEDEEPPPAAERRAPRRRAATRSAPGGAELFDPSGVHLLENDDFARSGWPAGTRMHLEPAQRAARGDLVVVREAGRTHVGWFGADRGRPALLTDRGSTWISGRARVVAVVTAVEPTLCD